jgi:amino-acid N-acetyltransferase
LLWAPFACGNTLSAGYNRLMIRCATIADVPAFGRIINDAAEYGLMLHRSQAYLYEHVRDFCVATETDGTHSACEKVVGVCGLNIVWGNLAEVYALAVDPAYRAKGLGSQLVQAVMRDAKQLGIARLMTLTYEQRFFERLHFSIVDRQELPLKVWSQCVHCLKNHACDEIAMIHQLEGVADAIQSETLSQDHTQNVGAFEYDVPVQIQSSTFENKENRAPMTHAPADE